MSALFAFLHHLFAFTLVADQHELNSERRDEPSATQARRVQIVDAVFGASAALLLIVGLLRVFYFEKGAAFYFSNAFFIAKLALFVAVGVISIGPTREFLSWGRTLRSGGTPAIHPAKLASLRRAMHWELIGVVLIILCAALMARGVGQIG